MALNPLPTRDRRRESWQMWRTHREDVRQTVIQVLCAEFAWTPAAPWQTEWVHSGERHAGVWTHTAPDSVSDKSAANTKTKEEEKKKIPAIQIVLFISNK